STPPTKATRSTSEIAPTRGQSGPPQVEQPAGRVATTVYRIGKSWLRRPEPYLDLEPISRKRRAAPQSPACFRSGRRPGNPALPRGALPAPAPPSLRDDDPPDRTPRCRSCGNTQSIDRAGPQDPRRQDESPLDPSSRRLDAVAGPTSRLRKIRARRS